MLKLAPRKMEYRTILHWVEGVDKTLDKIAYLENIVAVAILPSPPVSKKKA